MEEAEAVAHCEDSHRDAMRAQLKTRVDACLADIVELIQNHDHDSNRAAATALHQARYHKKALHDLVEGTSL